LNASTKLRDGVHRAYSAVAEQPEAEHPFAVGKQFAAGLGYPVELLDRLPPVCVQAFTGVSNVSLFADLPPGARVLDLGCGAGLDSVIAAQRVGSEGLVLGVDFSQAMLARARQGARDAGMNNVVGCQASAEELPLAGRSVDVALVNGLFTLNPGREAIFRALARIVHPGGSVYAAELILREPAPEAELLNPEDWFA
jgi:SAM-dependent methyltransferase